MEPAEFMFFAFRPAGQSAVAIQASDTIIDVSDRKELDDLGAQGWNIVGMCLNPRYSDQVLVALQRPRSRNSAS